MGVKKKMLGLLVWFSVINYYQVLATTPTGPTRTPAPRTYPETNSSQEMGPNPRLVTNSYPRSAPYDFPEIDLIGAELGKETHL